eukprot:1343117-Prymnesium_polylepis.1
MRATSTFQAVTQSLLISGCGKAATILRARSKAEAGNVDKIADGVMKDQSDAAAEAAEGGE